MSDTGALRGRDFHYRLPMRFGGQRPGAHQGTSLGSGQGFAAHRRLFDHPDPRRLDLRASVRAVRQDWLVRIQRQRVAVPVHAVVDVSASMHFGGAKTKLQVAADFVEALGRSAFGAGDPLGLLAYDHDERADLLRPARHGRGIGTLLAGHLRRCEPHAGQRGAFRLDRHGLHRDRRDPLAGLQACAARLAGRRGLVFLVSDFHGPLDGLGPLLDLLANACVVPMIAWDPAETEPPPAQALLAVSDAESHVRRTLLLRDGLRRDWRAAVAARRAALHVLFDARGMQPFHLHGADGEFDAEGLTRHFLEAVA